MSIAHHMNRSTLGIVAAIAFVLCLAVSIWAPWKRKNPLTSVTAQDIASLHVIDSTQVEREVSRPGIGKVLLQLSSEIREPSPWKWQTLALVTIKLRNGKTISVRVYDTARARVSHEMGCFSVNEHYFKGGDEEVLRRLLELPDAGSDN